MPQGQERQTVLQDKPLLHKDSSTSPFSSAATRLWTLRLHTVTNPPFEPCFEDILGTCFLTIDQSPEHNVKLSNKPQKH